MWQTHGWYIIPYTALYCIDIPYVALYSTDIPYAALYCTDIPYAALYCTDIPSIALTLLNVKGGICMGSVLLSGPLVRSGIAPEFLLANPKVTSSESSPILRSGKGEGKKKKKKAVANEI